MLTKLRLLLISLASMAMLAGLAAVPPSAHARPDRPMPAADYTHRATVSSTEHTALKLAVKLKKQTKGKKLDYRKATKVFKANKKHGTSWRRQYAAGWKLGGGTITHVSKAELKKIEGARKRYQPKPRRVSSDLRLRADANCRGRNGYVYHDFHRTDYYNWNYLDSCRANKVVRNFGWCMGAAGLLGVLAGNPGVSAMMAILFAGCGGAKEWISTAQSNSSINAVIIQTGGTSKYNPNPSPKNPVRWQVPVRIVPQ